MTVTMEGQSGRRDVREAAARFPGNPKTGFPNADYFFLAFLVAFLAVFFTAFLAAFLPFIAMSQVSVVELAQMIPRSMEMRISRFHVVNF
jgi:hypothetical protein